MTAEGAPHIWSREALVAKAQRYADEMLKQERGDWLFGFWASLCLEMLLRAVVADTSPVLLADNKDWNNVYFGLGQQPSAAKFTPRSIQTNEVISRLESIAPSFTKEMQNFTTGFVVRRNGELHSGELAFDGLRTSDWLGTFYMTCQVLLEVLGERLDLIFGQEEERLAANLIDALKDDAAKAVMGTIVAHRKVWEEKTEEERETLKQQAELFARRQAGHVVTCPACGTAALLRGDPSHPPVVSLEDDTIVERQQMLPASFECGACGLRISGYSKLHAANLGDSFAETTRYDATDYFGVGDKAIEWDPDFNE